MSISLLKDFINEKYNIESDLLSQEELNNILKQECKSLKNPFGTIEGEYIKVVSKVSQDDANGIKAYDKLKRKLLEDIPIELFESFHIYTPEEIVDSFIKQFIEKKQYGNYAQCLNKYCYVLISIIGSWQVSKTNDIFKKA